MRWCLKDWWLFCDGWKDYMLDALVVRWLMTDGCCLMGDGRKVTDCWCVDTCKTDDWCLVCDGLMLGGCLIYGCCGDIWGRMTRVWCGWWTKTTGAWSLVRWYLIDWLITDVKCSALYQVCVLFNHGTHVTYGCWKRQIMYITSDVCCLMADGGWLILVWRVCLLCGVV